MHNSIIEHPLIYRSHLVHVGSHEIVQLVKNAIDDLHQKVALLVLQCGRHEQGKDLVEESVCTKLPRLVCELSQCRLGERRWRQNLLSIHVYL